MKQKRILIFLFAFVSWMFSFAQTDCIPSKPNPVKLVNNFSKEAPDFLSADQQQALENKLEGFANNTSNQIVVLIVDDLCDYSANEYATLIGQNWGVGQGKFDNGAVLLIKPTGGNGQRKIYIAVGYGLEGAIPDATSKRIIEQEIVPRFKAGSYYEGIDAATNVLISLANKEYNYKDYNKKGGNGMPNIFVSLIIMVVIFFFAFRRSNRYTISRGGRTFYGGGFGAWGGGFGGGSSGGGGGFGGFGGGGFGGGGSGGSW